jgi:hypothetical protein
MGNPERYVRWRELCWVAVAVYILAVIAATVISIERTPAVSSAPVTNNNTNIIHDPRAELRQSLTEQAWATLKEQENARSVRD